MTNINKEKKINTTIYIASFIVISILCVITINNIKTKKINEKKIIAEKNEVQKSDAIPVLKDTTYDYIAPSDKKKYKNNTSEKNKIILRTDVETNDFFIKDNLENKNINQDEQQNKKLFVSFDDKINKMSWPINGKIIMNFSKNSLIYDKTLEQYRTNESISISSQFGDQVKCVADGIVKLISKTDEDGNLIVIDHGNDWSTVYSQLQDGILVKQGDLVKRSQIIGGINKPTKYSVLLGTHLGFKVIHKDNSINPSNILTTLES
ncbi:MAG: M23 family metallopeptidase [Clostridiales bacterium]|jgi:murein DD-endopeptidase MepM/ murein hydrolase activator NlpD|nr:M23 family metallopeptidase [Clostridiales bacterium]